MKWDEEVRVATTFHRVRTPQGNQVLLPEMKIGEVVPVHLTTNQQAFLARRLGKVPRWPQGLQQQAQPEVFRPDPPLGGRPAALRIPLYPLPPV